MHAPAALILIVSLFAQQAPTFKGHTETVSRVAFSKDGKRIVSGSLDRTAKVWDATSGQEIVTFKGHSNAVTDVAFSPNGNRPPYSASSRLPKLRTPVAICRLPRTYKRDLLA